MPKAENPVHGLVLKGLLVEAPPEVKERVEALEKRLTAVIQEALAKDTDEAEVMIALAMVTLGLTSK